MGVLFDGGSEISQCPERLDAVTEREIPDSASEQGVVSPVAARDISVIECCTGAGDPSLAQLVDKPQLVVVGAVFYVKAIHAEERGKGVLLNRVGIQIN